MRVYKARNDDSVSEVRLGCRVFAHADSHNSPVVSVFHESVSYRLCFHSRIKIFRSYSLHYNKLKDLSASLEMASVSVPSCKSSDSSKTGDNAVESGSAKGFKSSMKYSCLSRK